MPGTRCGVQMQVEPSRRSPDGSRFGFEPSFGRIAIIQLPSGFIDSRTWVAARSGVRHVGRQSRKKRYHVVAGGPGVLRLAGLELHSVRHTGLRRQNRGLANRASWLANPTKVDFG